MRLLFCSRPAYGHLYPLMPLAAAARSAGHEVVVATASPFASTVAAAGFATVDAGITMAEARARLGSDLALADADGRPDLAAAARLFIDVLGARSAADLAPRLEELAPDLVVYEQGELGGAVAAGAAGLLAVCHAISPLPMAAIAAASRERLARLWGEHGVASPPFDAFAGEVLVDPVPARLRRGGLGSPPARVAVRPTPWSAPGAVLPPWVGTRDRPLAYLTLGTVFGSGGDLAPAIEALGRLDADVLVALGSAADPGLTDVPRDVQVVRFADQAGVLPHADLVVHHGGSGTLLGALAHGRRQLLLPKGADQFSNAGLLRDAGMATVLEPEQVSVEAIEAAARAALAAPVPAPVLAVRDEIAAMPSPPDALAALLTRIPPSRSPAVVGA